MLSGGRPRSIRALGLNDEAPGGGEEGGGEVELEDLAWDEGVEAVLEGLFEVGVEDDGEPGQSDEENDEVAGEDGAEGGGEAAVSTPLGEASGEGGGEDEADEVAAAGARDLSPAVGAVGVDGCAGDADEDIEQGAAAAADGSERCADEENGKRLAGDRHGGEGERDRDLRGSGDQAGAAHDEEDVRQDVGLR
jgi:hypothetical protein